eukprot:2805631-Amphidinium_carterae.1
MTDDQAGKVRNVVAQEKLAVAQALHAPTTGPGRDPPAHLGSILPDTIGLATSSGSLPPEAAFPDQIDETNRAEGRKMAK